METIAKRVTLTPRYIRVGAAPAYLAMDRNRFNAEIRPYLTEIRLGKQGKAFELLELDAVADQYKARNGRPGRPFIGDTTWDAKKHQDSPKGAGSGTSTSVSAGGEFAKALEQLTLKRQNNS